MSIVELPYFGKVSIDKSVYEQEFQTYVRFKNTLVEFNLIYDTEDVEIQDLIILKRFLDEFNSYEEKAKNAILKNYKVNGKANEFIQTHVDALVPLGKELLKETFAKGMTLDEYFLQELELNVVWIFPEDPDEYIKLNYNVSDDFTDELLFVRFGKDLSVKEIGIEF